MPRRRRPPIRFAIVATAAVVAALASPVVARGQEGGLARALDLEAAGSYREAAAAFRAAIAGPDTVGALLGLERAYASLGWTDSLIPILDTLVASRPDDALVRSVQLRALVMAGREAGARDAYEAWAARAPRDAQPYRDYARLLMEGGRTQAADSVLERAVAMLGSGRGVALELAQLRTLQGRWVSSATNWRDAVEEASYLQRAAVYSLQGTPVQQRDSVRRALLAGPMEPAVRGVVARLELAWGSPVRAWRAIAELPPTDSVVTAWHAFAEEAEAAGAFDASFDAFRAAHLQRPSAERAARAAMAALEIGRAADALAIVQDIEPDDSSAMLLLPIRVRALSATGRLDDAARLVGEVSERAPHLAPPLYRQLAWGWVRAGELDRARDALARGNADPADEVYGWLALYAGDLRTARLSLRPDSEAGSHAVAAAALLARTTADSAPAAGSGFLALARGDTATAAASFERAAPEVEGAAPLVLSIAARLHAARDDGDRAVAVWRRIVDEHPSSPEAAEADLAWARMLGARGANDEAAARLEHLILTYPGSALVPQARRELDIIRGAVSPGADAPSPPPPASSPELE